MKKHILLSFLFILPLLAWSQNCSGPLASMDLHGNNIQARILNGGDLFTDFSTGQFLPNPSPSGAPTPSTLFAAGLWMGGIGPAGNLKLSTVAYRNPSGETAYIAGPLNEDGSVNLSNCSNWDRLFKVSGPQVNHFIQNLDYYKTHLTEAITEHPEIMGWPAIGNPYFEQIHGFQLPFISQSLASFYDFNQDAVYDPLAGDYPAVALRGKSLFVPAEMVWCVFNDGGNLHHGGTALGMEIQLSAWAFNCPDNNVANNTIFTSHKLLYKGNESIDSFYLGMWTDFDLGCYTDDYLGCSPSLNTIFAYNADAVDGTIGGDCQGVPSFGTDVPVQTLSFLGGNLDHFMGASSYNLAGATLDPTDASGFYNALSGSWPDGTPLTYGGTGYNPGSTTIVNHLFTDPPQDINGWSMCSVNLLPIDGRSIGTQKIGTLLPGAVNEFNCAWGVHFNADLPCNLGNTLDEVAEIRDLYDNDFGSLCSPLKAPEAPPGNEKISLAPNPASDAFVIRWEGLDIQSVHCFDAAGRLVFANDEAPKAERQVNTSNWSPGIYTIRLQGKQGVYLRKAVVVR